MRKRIGLLLVASLLIVVLLAACGGGGGNEGSSGDSGSGGSGNTVSITMTDMKFTPDVITAKPGEKVTVKLKNDGAVPHDFTIDDIGGTKVQTHVEPGKTGEATFTVPTSGGPWQFYCTQPGHKEANMVGQVKTQ
ncbi:MAG: cupredoxin domain-containing protein [Thermomicrobiaceae bacterium]|nr:cupredoxin domain-containing protein [Thermomicrobiaceae bacterium]